MLERWEYMSYTVDHGPLGGEPRPNHADWLDALNSLGNEGWEVTGQVKTRDVTSGMLVPQLLLKRRRVV